MTSRRRPEGYRKLLHATNGMHAVRMLLTVITTPDPDALDSASRPIRKHSVTSTK